MSPNRSKKIHVLITMKLSVNFEKVYLIRMFFIDDNNGFINFFSTCYQKNLCLVDVPMRIIEFARSDQWLNLQMLLCIPYYRCPI